MAKPPPAIAVPFKKLVALLGKPVDDPEVTALLATAGKVKTDSDFILAKQAGFDFALDRSPGVKKKVLDTLFLFADGADGHAGFTGLPKPYAFTDRATLRKGNPPDVAWTLDDGDVDLDHPASERDTWKKLGYEISANYSDEGVARYFTVTGTEQDRGGRDISTSPLHFEAAPVDAPKDAALVGMGLLLGWATRRFGVPAKHAGKDFTKRSPVTLLRDECASTLTTLDVAPELGDFLVGYTHRTFVSDRKPDPQIKKLLQLSRADEVAYTDDFLGTFKGAVKSPFYVPDSWTAVDRIAPILDARWADYQATKFKAPAKLALYTKAAAQRDKVKITAHKATTAKVSVPDAIAPQLIALLGSSVKDAKPVLASVGLPIGKRIDQQANPAAGIAYMGSNLVVGGKKTLCVTGLDFYAAGYETHVRGIGSSVVFAAFTQPIVLGITITDDRKAVRKKLGKPHSTYETYDYWYPDKKHRITAKFGKRDKLEFLYLGLIDEEDDPATPPFGPKGIFRAAA